MGDFKKHLKEPCTVGACSIITVKFSVIKISPKTFFPLFLMTDVMEYTLTVDLIALQISSEIETLKL